MYYNYIKALHLIFVITWFAGLFYIPRLFIYHVEGLKKSENEAAILTAQFKIMEKRLWYIITWPSAILTILFAAWLLALMPEWLVQPWMHLKLLFVALLIAYHLKTHKMFLRFQQDKITYSSMYLRIWNEGATLLLFAIVFLVILKDSLHWISGLLGFLGLAGVLFLGIKLYKKTRKSK
ncbi:CopD family protein [Flavobacteriaceae bacterium]|nr:CopD family protein [Flavobacteriaceae bacterium]MDA9015367.1 CopD family protein [Flavobacteriaceae bacterium]MDB3862887.1 CopD family protein [Flavobacteriaceae bacterium]